MGPEKHATRGDTKQNLILSALELFANQGIDAVSMRTINQAAGTRNASAVHYHFGSKLGIIEAIIEFVLGQLDAHRVDNLAKLEARLASGDTPTPREVIWAMFNPYVMLQHEPGFGRAAIRFLARLQTEMSPEIRAIMNRDPQRTAQRFDALLGAVLPHLPDDVRRTRLLYCWTLTVHGFARAETWEHTRFGSLMPPTPEAATQRFFDYLAGGMEAPITENADAFS